jgi:hypothetical protein
MNRRAVVVEHAPGGAAGRTAKREAPSGLLGLGPVARRLEVRLPAHPLGSEAGGVGALVPDWPAAQVLGRVKGLTGVAVAGVGELEVEAIVAAHLVGLRCSFVPRYC